MVPVSCYRVRLCCSEISLYVLVEQGSISESTTIFFSDNIDILCHGSNDTQDLKVMGSFARCDHHSESCLGQDFSAFLVFW